MGCTKIRERMPATVPENISFPASDVDDDVDFEEEEEGIINKYFFDVLLLKLGIFFLIVLFVQKNSESL